MNSEFCVRYDCRNRRFTGCKSRFLQEVDGAKGTSSAAAELCGVASSHMADILAMLPQKRTVRCIVEQPPEAQLADILPGGMHPVGQ